MPVEKFSSWIKEWPHKAPLLPNPLSVWEQSCEDVMLWARASREDRHCPTHWDAEGKQEEPGMAGISLGLCINSETKCPRLLVMGDNQMFLLLNLIKYSFIYTQSFLPLTPASLLFPGPAMFLRTSQLLSHCKGQSQCNPQKNLVEIRRGEKKQLSTQSYFRFLNSSSIKHGF